MINIVAKTIKKLVLSPKLDEAKTLGIIKKITKGFTIPPVKQISNPNWKMSINKNNKADLSES